MIWTFMFFSFFYFCFLITYCVFLLLMALFFCCCFLWIHLHSCHFSLWESLLFLLVKSHFFYSKNKLCSSISYSICVLMFACNSNRIYFSTSIKEQLEFIHMCLLWSLCAFCAVPPINYSHLSPSQLQQFVKTKRFKNKFTICKRERVIVISEHGDSIFMYMNSLCWSEMFPTPSFYIESYMGLLLFISYFY